MAHKAKSYYIGTNKAGKNFIALYDNVTPTDAEQKMIDRFISMGYDVRFEEKKASRKVEDMRKELATDKDALDEFEQLYSGTKKIYKKDGEEQTPFFAACQYFNAWVKKNKKK